MTSSWEIRAGDALTRLREMPDRSVQTVITSPPYFGLRDYGTGEWEGGEAGCDHMQKVGGTSASTLGEASGGHAVSDEARVQSTKRSFVAYRDVCGKCGARRTDRQLGLEATPDAFIAALVEVFREVRRVLRDDGTLWLNMGDSYNAYNGNRGAAAGRAIADAQRNAPERGLTTTDAKAKDLLMIPAQLALALRADGWYLRSDIILAKVNPMPESVRDRPTSAHEHMFLLAKRPSYFYDADAIREEPSDNPGGAAFYAAKGLPMPSKSDARKCEAGRGDGPDTSGFASRPPDYSGGRNKRNVWTVTSEGFPGAHFATFGTKWIEPCVLAGTSPKACGECGAPWRRVVAVSYENPGNRTTSGPRSIDRRHLEHGSAGYGQRLERRGETVGWESSCAHDDDTGRSVIFDPFAGSGTTGVVALRHDRSFIGIELNPEYAEMARNRIRDDAPLLNTLTEVAV